MMERAEFPVQRKRTLYCEGIGYAFVALGGAQQPGGQHGATGLDRVLAAGSQQQQRVGSQQAVAPVWALVRLEGPGLRRAMDWFGMALASYVYVKANILLQDISVKAYI
jgi:hypothetical protein